MKAIWFDMDGTLANLYAVDNWLDYLINYDTTPYKEASVMLNMNQLARKLNKLQSQGWKIGVISWLSKCSTPEYDKAVTSVKLSWLHKHLKSVNFDEINIVAYGTPKHKIGTGILFDDEERNRNAWGENAFSPDEIMQVLSSLLA